MSMRDFPEIVRQRTSAGIISAGRLVRHLPMAHHRWTVALNMMLSPLSTHTAPPKSPRAKRAPTDPLHGATARLSLARGVDRPSASSPHLGDRGRPSPPSGRRGSQASPEMPLAMPSYQALVGVKIQVSRMTPERNPCVH